MALVPETGTGVANADTFVTLAEFAAYVTAQARTIAATVTDAQKEGALRYAAKWVGTRGNWIAGRLTTTQALDFPISASYDLKNKAIAAVPQAVKDAQCEAAIAHITGESLAEPLKRGGAIVAASVGPVSVTYAGNAPAGSTYRFIDSLLRPLMLSSGGSIQAVLG